MSKVTLRSGRVLEPPAKKQTLAPPPGRLPPAQIKYNALEGLLAYMHMHAPWDETCLEAQPTLDKVRAAIREADARGRNSCTYFLGKNGFSPSHFSDALRAGGDGARFVYVPGVLARAWAGSNVERFFRNMYYAAFFNCGMGGLMFVRACLPTQYFHMLISSVQYVAQVGPHMIEPALREKLLAFEHPNRNSYYAWVARVSLEVAFDTDNGRLLLADTRSYATVLGTAPDGAVPDERSVMRSVLSGAFHSHNVDIFRRVLARFESGNFTFDPFFFHGHFVMTPSPDIFNFIFDQDWRALAWLLSHVGMYATLCQKPRFNELFASSNEARRDSIRHALFACSGGDRYQEHWSICSEAVHAPWFGAILAGWHNYQRVSFLSFIHRNVVPDPAFDAQIDLHLAMPQYAGPIPWNLTISQARFPLFHRLLYPNGE
jgi:hypothetical protein